MNRKSSAKRKPSMAESEEIQGEILSSQDRFWLETVKALMSSSITPIEEAAKQLIGLVTLLQGIFFAIVATSDLKDKLAVLMGRNEYWYVIVLIMLPLCCWALSLWLSILVFLPKAYAVNLGSPDLSRETFFQIVEYKHKRLLQAYTALAAGFVPLIAAILVYLTT